MRIVVYRHVMEWSNSWLDAFCVGLSRHGIEAERANYQDGGRRADVAVMYGISRPDLIDRLKARGTRCLIMEMGYVGNRYRYQSLLWDGLNGRGSHPKAGDGGKRWRRRFGKMLQPWREGGDHVLLVGQYAPDQSVRYIDVEGWYRRSARQIAEATSLPIIFRPHPFSDECGLPVPELPSVEVRREPLGELLENAAFAVTINSNTGVLAALAGVPIVATDRGAMCWPVAGHSVGEIVRPDRTEWAHELAWAQWKKDEIRRGYAWEHLRQ